MRSLPWFISPGLVLASLISATPAHGQQVFESVGERALGMGGAFVAVADDATATHWNPAGLVLGRPAGMTLGWNRFEDGDQHAPPVPGIARRSASLSSIGTWPLGISYGRFRTLSISTSSDEEMVARAFQNTIYAATLLQSVVDGLVVGTTLKYMRGGVAEMIPEGETAGDVLDRVDDAEIDTSGTFDLDFGAMADFQYFRLGLTWRNLRSPSFGEVATLANTLPRQARVGLAILPTSGLTFAMDLDLDTVDLTDGPRRMFALGGEAQINPRFAIRSGIRWSLEGSRRRTAAVGSSVMFRAGLWLDGHYSHGSDEEGREFGASLRAGF